VHATGRYGVSIGKLLGLAALALALAVTAAGGAGTSRAAAHPQIAVGGFPTGIAINPATDTIYVGNGDTGTLSLINGKTCNAGSTRGCSQHVTAVTAGIDPIGIAVEQSTNTLYVANASGTVAVVDGNKCRAADTSGCRREPATVPVGLNPQFLAVDEKTHTVYVANSASNTVSVIDSRRKRVRASISVGPAPFTVVVNDATGSVYVADLGANTVSVIDGTRCNATDVSGCKRPPVTVNVGDTPGGIALDSKTDTIYVTGQVTDDVSVIDGKTCNARVTSGCRKRPVHVLAGIGARGIAVNEKTNTIYVANTAAGTVSAIDGSTCNATVTSGCRQHAAAAPVGISPRRVAVDEVTNTVYVTNAGSNTVTMIDGRTCNGRVHTGCGEVPVPGSSGTSSSTTTTTPAPIA
jgi:YVTN family beta-propeller protein